MTRPAATPILSPSHYAILTAAFAAFVVYGSLVPLTYRPLPMAEARERFAAEMSKPLSFESRSDWASNVLLFVPLGFVGMGAVAVDRHRPGAAVLLVPAMLALSAAVEFAQVWFPPRNTAINDVVAETIGGALGVSVWLVAGQTITVRVRAAWTDLGPGDWAAKALPAYLLYLVIAHGMPFDLSISPTEIVHKYRRGLEPDAVAAGVPQIAVAPAPARVAEKTLMNLVYFLPLGALIARLPDRRWRTSEALGRVFAAGLGVAAAIEALQLIVLSCGCYASDVLSGGLFVLAGWKLSTRRRPASLWARHVAWATWCFALAFVNWTPFDLDPDAFANRMIGGEWIPFADYYAGNYIAAFNRILNKTVLFLPVGFLLARPGMNRMAAAAVIGTGLATIIELGQAFSSAHRPSLSDIIIGGVGAVAGAVVASRLPQVRASSHPTHPVEARERHFISYGEVL